MVQTSEESQVSAQVSTGEQTDIPTNFGAGGEKIMTWNLEYFSSMDGFFRIHENVCSFALHGSSKKKTVKKAVDLKIL